VTWKETIMIFRDTTTCNIADRGVFNVCLTVHH